MAETMIPMPGMEVEISVQGMQASRFEAIEAAEAARSTAETERESAESARAGAEQARVNAESVRNAAESGRKAAEEEREQNEAARAEAEGGRATAESARVEAENLRALAETGRAASEAARAAAESARVSAEQVRAEAEAEREAAEAERQSVFGTNEAHRQEVFVAAEHSRAAAETARASAEAARENAESERVAAEKLREETFAGYDGRFADKLDNTPDTWPGWTTGEQKVAREKLGVNRFTEIADITLEEDSAPIISLGCECEALFIVFDIPAGDTCISSLYIRNQIGKSIAFYPTNTIMVSAARFVSSIIEKYGDRWSCDVQWGGNNSASQLGSNRSVYINATSTISELIFSNPMRAGTKISVYGVKS